MIRSLFGLRRWFDAPSLPEPFRCRPSLETLEDRLTPAFDLTISTAATNLAVTVVSGSGLTTFTATATGANIYVGDIRATWTPPATSSSAAAPPAPKPATSTGTSGPTWTLPTSPRANP